jgi:hypothetical protein
MSERSEPHVTPLRLVLDFGDTVELDGSSIYDPTEETTVPAVILRMPPHRAAYLGEVLDKYTLVSRLAGADPVTEERGPAWALGHAAAAAGFVDRPDEPRRVTSAQRMAAAAALQASRDFDTTTVIAVVDAAARWLEEPDGGEFAYALLGAVTDEEAQSRAFAELTGPGGRDA